MGAPSLLPHWLDCTLAAVHCTFPRDVVICWQRRFQNRDGCRRGMLPRVNPVARVPQLRKTITARGDSRRRDMR